jgi:hypothetical protein
MLVSILCQGRLPTWQTGLQIIKYLPSRCSPCRLHVKPSSRSNSWSTISGRWIGSRYTLSKTRHGSVAIYLVLTPILFCLSYFCPPQVAHKSKLPRGEVPIGAVCSLLYPVFSFCMLQAAACLGHSIACVSAFVSSRTLFLSISRWGYIVQVTRVTHTNPLFPIKGLAFKTKSCVLNSAVYYPKIGALTVSLCVTCRLSERNPCSGLPLPV